MMWKIGKQHVYRTKRVNLTNQITVVWMTKKEDFTVKWSLRATEMNQMKFVPLITIKTDMT